MWTISEDDEIHLGFILGKGKLTPTHGHSVPRLELCTAVLAVELSSSISDHLSLPIEEFRLYSDSREVLGYISNTSRRFYKYVSNRVSFIRKVTNPEQWSFVSTERNPADQATRFLSSEKMQNSSWLKGSSQLLVELTIGDQVFEIVEPGGDKEVRPEVRCNNTRITFQCLGSHRFARFSVWKNLKKIHKTADAARAQFGEDVMDFIKNQFYVDDGLVSLPTVQEAVDLIKRTQQALASEGKLRLHKISSNSQEVLNSFPTDDLAKGIKDPDFGTDSLPNQRSLGLVWNLESDTFIFQTPTSDRPYTRRGVLSTINSIFDPLGFIAPVVVEGNHLLRTLVHDTVDWDEPLSQFEN